MSSVLALSVRPILTAPSTFSLCCIAPVLAAKVIKGVEVTVGHEQEEGGKWPYAGTAEAIEALGAKHCVKGVTISFLAASQCGVKQHSSVIHLVIEGVCGRQPSLQELWLLVLLQGSSWAGGQGLPILCGWS